MAVRMVSNVQALDSERSEPEGCCENSGADVFNAVDTRLAGCVAGPTDTHRLASLVHFVE